WGAEPHAPVTIPGLPDLHRREEDWQRGRGHHVADADLRTNRAPVRALPRLDVPALHPGDGLARGVARRADRDRVQPPLVEIPLDARELSIHRTHRLHEQIVKWFRIDHSPDPRCRRSAGNQLYPRADDV